MEEKKETEKKRFTYERPVLVNLTSSDFALYQGGNQCNSGSVAAVGCSAGTAV